MFFEQLIFLVVFIILFIRTKSYHSYGNYFLNPNLLSILKLSETLK